MPTNTPTNSTWLEHAGQRIAEHYPQLYELESVIIGNLPVVDGRESAALAQKARLYLRLYGLPVLEAAGLLDVRRFRQAVAWGSVQICLSLYIRTIDYVLDADHDGVDNTTSVWIATACLIKSQLLVQALGLPWSGAQFDVLQQHLLYEIESRRGHRHEMGLLWRRASPLCVVGETYLADAMTVPNFQTLYRSYLGWSLLRADCGDLFDDLKMNRLTPLTILVQEERRGDYQDLAVALEIQNRVMALLDRRQRWIRRQLNDTVPAWNLLFDLFRATETE